MVDERHTVLATVVLLLVVGAGTAVTGLPVPAQEQSETQPQAQSPTQPGGQSENAGAAAGCDYTTLYDETIDSVVALRTNDGGLGSGFAYSTGENESTAYLVTNAHVVRGSDSVLVQFADGHSRTGQVVGEDPAVDLAVVRVNETPEYVEALPVEDSLPDEGRQVAALGTPFGLDETITHGIVSGVNRSMPTQRGFTIPNVVQTDAPINPGNSGGPLVTCNGTVVGVNTAGIGAEQGENVGFAVSSSTLARVAPALVEDGEYDHAYLGIRSIPVTARLLEANDVEATGGVYVHEVPTESPASGALQGTTGYETVDGARVPVGGDFVVAIDGNSVASGEALSSHLLSETRPGDTVTLTTVRDGERQQVNVTLGERPEPETTGPSVATP